MSTSHPALWAHRNDGTLTRTFRSDSGREWVVTVFYAPYEDQWRASFFEKGGSGVFRPLPSKWDHGLTPTTAHKLLCSVLESGALDVPADVLSQLKQSPPHDHVVDCSLMANICDLADRYSSFSLEKNAALNKHAVREGFYWAYLETLAIRAYEALPADEQGQESPFMNGDEDAEDR